MHGSEVQGWQGVGGEGSCDAERLKVAGTARGAAGAVHSACAVPERRTLF